ncbi:MAG: A24 family peptidase [Actinomycetota bacterium]|nr:A24 family peptidase [Actinomycetota bacterium]
MIAFVAVRGNPPTTAHRVAQALAAVPSVARWAWAGACATSCLIASAQAGPVATQVCTGVAGVVLATAALVDVHERRLPNRLLAAAGLLVLLAAAADGRVAPSLVGALVAGGLLLVVRLARSVGMGDVKMATVVGAGVVREHPVAAPVAIAVAAMAGAGTGLVLRRSSLPFGPALWLGWAVAVILPVGRWWA